MNVSGGNELVVAARTALLDALDALSMHLHAVIVIGALAYLAKESEPELRRYLKIRAM